MLVSTLAASPELTRIAECAALHAENEVHPEHVSCRLGGGIGSVDIQPVQAGLQRKLAVDVEARAGTETVADAGRALGRIIGAAYIPPVRVPVAATRTLAVRDVRVDERRAETGSIIFQNQAMLSKCEPGTVLY